jgi:hypothetical protein
MKELLALSFLSFSILHAENSPVPEPVKEQFFYANCGTAYICPSAGLGWRYQKNHFGFDSNFKAVWFYGAGAASQERVSVLYYPFPNSEKQYYGGVGIVGMGSLAAPISAHSFGAVMAFGKSHTNERGGRRFWQVDLELYPMHEYIRREYIRIAPVVSFSYGFAF